MARNGGRRRSDWIGAASSTDLSAVGASDCKGPPRRRAERHPGPAADQVRSRRQSKNRQGDRADYPRIRPHPRRRGDRIGLPMSCIGPSRRFRHFRFGWERTLVNRMPDECKIGIEVNPKVVLGKPIIRGPSRYPARARWRLMMPAHRAAPWLPSDRACQTPR